MATRNWMRLVAAEPRILSVGRYYRDDAPYGEDEDGYIPRSWGVVYDPSWNLEDGDLEAIGSEATEGLVVRYHDHPRYTEGFPYNSFREMSLVDFLDGGLPGMSLR